jgi:formiminoglutamase
MGHVVNGRFKGGYITRAYGNPDKGVHAVQMELACRSYLPEPSGTPDPANWPPSYDPAYAAPVRESLREILVACSRFSKGTP